MTDAERVGALERLDVALTRRGLAKSRTTAGRLIELGRVSVNGERAGKPSARVGAADRILVEPSGDDYVSRAALKLVAALDAFELDAAGRVVLDVGASTGGFTQVALERDARAVVALDVGHDQLAPVVRDDERVLVLEGVNARHLTREGLDERIREAALRDGRRPVEAGEISLVVADLSFISLRHVVPAVVEAAPAATDFALLVKPQFEVGRTGVRGGIVVDPALVKTAVLDVLACAEASGLEPLDLIDSPVLGTHGNREFVARFRRAAGRVGGEGPGSAAPADAGPGAPPVRDAPAHPSEWADRVDALVDAAHRDARETTLSAGRPRTEGGSE